jgi:hypothetical protein
MAQFYGGLAGYEIAAVERPDGRVALILDPTGAAVGLAHVTPQEVQQ